MVKDKNKNILRLQKIPKNIRKKFSSEQLNTEQKKDKNGRYYCKVFLTSTQLKSMMNNVEIPRVSGLLATAGVISTIAIALNKLGNVLNIIKSKLQLVKEGDGRESEKKKMIEFIKSIEDMFVGDNASKHLLNKQKIQELLRYRDELKIVPTTFWDALTQLQTLKIPSPPPESGGLPPPPDVPPPPGMGDVPPPPESGGVPPPPESGGVPPLPGMGDVPPPPGMGGVPPPPGMGGVPPPPGMGGVPPPPGMGGVPSVSQRRLMDGVIVQHNMSDGTHFEDSIYAKNDDFKFDVELLKILQKLHPNKKKNQKLKKKVIKKVPTCLSNQHLQSWEIIFTKLEKLPYDIISYIDEYKLDPDYAKEILKYTSLLEPSKGFVHGMSKACSFLINVRNLKDYKMKLERIVYLGEFKSMSETARNGLMNIINVVEDVKENKTITRILIQFRTIMNSVYKPVKNENKENKAWKTIDFNVFNRLNPNYASALLMNSGKMLTKSNLEVLANIAIRAKNIQPEDIFKISEKAIELGSKQLEIDCKDLVNLKKSAEEHVTGLCRYLSVNKCDWSKVFQVMLSLCNILQKKLSELSSREASQSRVKKKKKDEIIGQDPMLEDIFRVL
jgi:hypothetical protein